VRYRSRDREGRRDRNRTDRIATAAAPRHGAAQGRASAARRDRPGSGAEPLPADEREAAALKYLVESRIVVEPRPGSYYLDLEAEARQRKARGNCLAILLAALAIGLFLFFGAFAWLAAMIAT